MVEGKLQATKEYNLKWFCEKAAVSLAKKVVALERNFITALTTEIETLRAELQNEKIANDKLEQYQRKDSVRITGIPHVQSQTNAQLEDKDWCEFRAW